MDVDDEMTTSCHITAVIITLTAQADESLIYVIYTIHVFINNLIIRASLGMN